jgi:hypothetical protein
MFAVHVFLAFFVIALAGVPLVYALLATTIGMIWAKGLSHQTIFLSYIGGSAVQPDRGAALHLRRRTPVAGRRQAHRGARAGAVQVRRTRCRLVASY